MKEIEAKFVLPDIETFEQLESIDQLADYRLSTGRTTSAHDTYLDTADQTILAAGYAYRRRQKDGQTLITLKGVEQADSAVHRREELETKLESDLPPSDWQPGDLRNWILWVMDQNRISPLFELQQTRTVHPVRKGRFKIAELSLDRVEVDAGKRKHAYTELEI